MPSSPLPVSAYEALELPDDAVKILTTPKPQPAAAASPNVLQASTAGQPVAPDQSSITLYAELLLHIRTVTLFASLRSFHTRETTARLSSDGCAITVSHEDESATLRLPVKAKGGGDAALSLPANPPSKELTLRLQIEEQDGSGFLRGADAEQRAINVVPWDGASLGQRNRTELLCKSCRGVAVPCGKLRDWRDLPNENWAEMMDFWHCHKPDEHHLHDHSHDARMEKKGYAAGNALAAAEGVGFADLLSFLLDERDCEGVEVSGTGEDRSLVCKHCKHVVGAPDHSANGWRIWKWRIDIPRNGPPSREYPSTSFATQNWISARLLCLIDNTGLRRFQIYATSNSDRPVPSLLLWVFTPDLMFSSSIRPSHDPSRAMKVFFEKNTFTPSRDGAQLSSSVEEVEFPGGLYEELERALEESQKLLPAGARKFQGWEVGLLERFDLSDVV